MEKIKEETIHYDCNQCGDYEYCGFHYDECTGFIPGDNYVFEKYYEALKKRNQEDENANN